MNLTSTPVIYLKYSFVELDCKAVELDCKAVEIFFSVNMEYVQVHKKISLKATMQFLRM